MSKNREQATPRNLLFDADEELDQLTAGLAYNREFATDYQLMLRNQVPAWE